MNLITSIKEHLLTWWSIVPFVLGWILNELVKPIIVKFLSSKFEFNNELLLIKQKNKLTALEEIYNLLLEFDSIYERLNSSFKEIPNKLKKLEELNMYIKSGSKLNNLLNTFYTNYYNINYYLNILDKNKDNDKMQAIKNIVITCIHDIPSISSKIKFELKKELN